MRYLIRVLSEAEAGWDQPDFAIWDLFPTQAKQVLERINRIKGLKGFDWQTHAIEFWDYSIDVYTGGYDDLPESVRQQAPGWVRSETVPQDSKVLPIDSCRMRIDTDGDVRFQFYIKHVDIEFSTEELPQSEFEAVADE